MKKLLLLILLLVSLKSYADEFKRKSISNKTLNILEWLEIIENYDGNVLEFYNCTIIYDYSLNDKLPWNFKDSILIKSGIFFENCEFLLPGSSLFTFKNLYFRGGFYFTDSKIGSSLNFSNCNFQSLGFYTTSIKYGVYLDSCSINSFGLSSCNISDGVEFKNCVLNGRPQNNPSHFSDFRNNQNLKLIYKNSVFTKDIIILDFDNNTFQSLEFYDCNFNCNVSFNSVIIDRNFIIRNSNFFKNISFINTQSPAISTDVNWEYIESKLFYVNGWRSLNRDSLGKCEICYSLHKPFYKETIDTAYDKYQFLALLNSYNVFYNIYKQRGDIESANACYVEMKDIETRRLKYLYKTEGGSKNYLNYNLNRFLKFFAEYGTSPVRSVQISGWVILIFGFFYFFFYSEWDKINRKFLITKSELLIGYFRSEQKLEDLYSDKHKEDLNTFTSFKQNLKESKSQVPFFFMLFLKPLYWLAVIKLNFNKTLYKRVEFLQGRWVDLTKGKKILLGTLTFLAILTYGIYLIAIRSLNSLILSINTFTTLGFGDIPVVGISRYVAILEGFLGWFLLSIFSVSLISQILQN